MTDLFTCRRDIVVQQPNRAIWQNKESAFNGKMRTSALVNDENLRSTQPIPHQHSAMLKY